MRHTLLALLSLATSVHLQACIDPEQPIGLSSSTFENEDLSVASLGGIRLGKFVIHFDRTENKWCIMTSREQTPDCERSTLTLTDKTTGRTVGVALLDSRTKTINLYQVKKEGRGQNFEIDKQATRIVFSDTSSGDIRRVEAQAIGPEGILGSVVAEHNIYTKGFPPDSPSKVDLANPKVRISGCYSTFQQRKAGELSKSRLATGTEKHR